MGGAFFTCFIPRDSDWGRLYLRKKAEGHRLYKYANLYTLDEIEELLKRVNFKIEKYSATLSRPPGLTADVEEPSRKISTHGFICIKAIKV